MSYLTPPTISTLPAGWARGQRERVVRVAADVGVDDDRRGTQVLRPAAVLTHLAAQLGQSGPRERLTDPTADSGR
ncbi:hypothetical protein OG216_35785 [Streptomycetaceae bacterium NBC_01309]